MAFVTKLPLARQFELMKMCYFVDGAAIFGASHIPLGLAHIGSSFVDKHAFKCTPFQIDYLNHDANPAELKEALETLPSVGVMSVDCCPKGAGHGYTWFVTIILTSGNVPTANTDLDLSPIPYDANGDVPKTDVETIDGLGEGVVTYLFVEGHWRTPDHLRS